MATVKPGKEIGREGLEAFYGRTSEPYTDQLRWPNCYDIYNEMRRRDPTLRAILNAIRMLGGQAEWKAEPATDKAPDREAAEFLDQCLDDMSHTVDDFIDDVWTCLPFGWYSAEICYKRRAGEAGKHKSRFDDGRIGWRKMAPRRQSTLDRWEFDDEGGLAGWHQMAPPAYDTVLLPIEKLLHFTCQRDGGNPEGISLFESAYEPYHFVTNLQIIGGIGWQRSFVGLPVFDFQENMSGEDKALAEAMGKALQVNEQQYAIIPPNVDFDLKTVANDSGMSLLSWLRHFRTMMSQIVLADFIFLGMGEVGSYALGQDKSTLFLMAVNSYLDRFAEVWNRHGVSRLFEYNEFPGVTEIPRITHSIIRKPNLPELGEFLQRIAPLITMSDDDELWIREQSGMPEIDLEELQKQREEKEAKAAAIAQQMKPKEETDSEKPETGESEDEAEEDENLSEFADPDLTPAERRRRTLERGIQRRVGGFLGEQRERVLDELAWAEYQWGRLPSDFWTNEREQLKKEMTGDLTRLVLELLQMASVEASAKIGTIPDWTLANADAAKWARGHVGDAIKGITDTTKNSVREIVANWVESGEDLPTLEKQLRQMTFGPVRAEMIASTEVTNTYAEAQDLTNQQAGLPAMAYKPSAHTRCRCGTRPELLPSGEWVVVWQTATDEKVCKRPLKVPWGTALGCEELQGRIISEGDWLGERLADAKRASRGRANPG